MHRIAKRQPLLEFYAWTIRDKEDISAGAPGHESIHREHCKGTANPDLLVE
jgi:hypothetical protein